MKVKDTKLRRMVLGDKEAIKAIRVAAVKGDQSVHVEVGGEAITFKRTAVKQAE